jgi:hypothetical protein
MALSGMQRAAIFEKLKKAGRINPAVPRIPTPHPKMPAPMAPAMASQMPQAPTNPDLVNPNYVGKGKAQRFKKLKGILGT